MTHKQLYKRLGKRLHKQLGLSTGAASSASGLTTIAAMGALCACAWRAMGQPSSPMPATAHSLAPSTPEYRQAVQRTAQMTDDSKAQRLAKRHGLDILNLTWEDTGRYNNSAVGPNISDMTIQVATSDPRTRQIETTCMPVIRTPNFADKSCDLDPHDFTLLVGNQTPEAPGVAYANHRSLRRVSLYDFLQEPTAFLTHPNSWKGGKPRTLLAPNRDSKVLVSAQACFLPVPRHGKATFNPVLFNYQSYAKNPAVLTILATREGTSMTVIDNTRDAFENGSAWGQRLFHNQGGQRASLTGERASDFASHGGDSGSDVGPSAPGTPAGLNMVLLIQIPLKQKPQPQRMYKAMEMAAAPAAPMMSRRAVARDKSNVENAVIGHGAMEGPYTELDDLSIERDPHFPVRVTVQFYKATDNGVVSPSDMEAIKSQIDHVYAHSDYVGSLVTQGRTGRVTEYEGAKVQPADWWERFWAGYEQHFHTPRTVAIARLNYLLGHDYARMPVTDLYVRTLLRHTDAP